MLHLCHIFGRSSSYPHKLKDLKIYLEIIHPTFSLMRDWFKRVTWLNIPQLKLGNIWVIFPNFQTACVARNIWRIINTTASINIKHESMLVYLHVLGHYLFLKAHSFPQAMFLENCSLLDLGLHSVRGQISQHIFAPNGGYCLFIIPYFHDVIPDVRFQHWNKIP